MLSRDIGTTLAVFWYIINYTRYRRERLRKFSFRVVAFLVIFKVELGGLVNNIVNATCFPCKKVNIRTQPAIPRRSRIVRSRHIQAQYESYTSTVCSMKIFPLGQVPRLDQGILKHFTQNTTRHQPMTHLENAPLIRLSAYFLSQEALEAVPFRQFFVAKPACARAREKRAEVFLRTCSGNVWFCFRTSLVIRKPGVVWNLGAWTKAIVI
jgi:hypothetical protein